MLPGALGLQFSESEMRIDLTSLTNQSGAELVIADANGIDLQAGQLLLSDREPIAFDALSIGVGSMPAGWQQHIRSPLLVPTKPMQTFLSRLDTRLDTCATEKSSPLRVVIIGGGVASVEIAFCLSQQRARKDPNRPISIEIITSGDSIAEGMKPRSIRHLQRLLNRRSIQIQSQCRVVEVNELGFVTSKGVRHKADVVIWATGATAPPVLKTLGLQHDDRGFIATHRTLQSLTDPRVFAVGDSGTIVESPSPKAGVYAVRQSPILWHNLRAFVRGQQLRKFVPQTSFLKILNTGDGKAFLEYEWFSVHNRWCWKLKSWIDRRFIHEFQE